MVPSSSVSLILLLSSFLEEPKVSHQDPSALTVVSLSFAGLGTKLDNLLGGILAFGSVMIVDELGFPFFALGVGGQSKLLIAFHGDDCSGTSAFMA